MYNTIMDIAEINEIIVTAVQGISYLGHETRRWQLLFENSKIWRFLCPTHIYK